MGKLGGRRGARGEEEAGEEEEGGGGGRGRENSNQKGETLSICSPSLTPVPYSLLFWLDFRLLRWV